LNGRHPFKQQERDTRAHGIIERYLGQHGTGNGHIQTIAGFAGHTAANQGRLSINRGARHYGLSPAAWVTDQHGDPCYRDCADPAAPHKVQFRLNDRDQARQHVFREAAGDPSRLKYNPYAPRNRIIWSPDDN